eukprot:TRINITY_DN18941_c0_g3_i1.p1 TRINITY_DN18941_c0_g3~~TRINITY_DN18941_c0_g3_i1.p1  ORF type:complete len:680 (-),score=139.87 TRINITY_DN18941_c0_g3_i1:278-2011(-)
MAGGGQYSLGPGSGMLGPYPSQAPPHGGVNQFQMSPQGGMPSQMMQVGPHGGYAMGDMSGSQQGQSMPGMYPGSYMQLMPNAGVPGMQAGMQAMVMSNANNQPPNMNTAGGMQSNMQFVMVPQGMQQGGPSSGGPMMLGGQVPGQMSGGMPVGMPGQSCHPGSGNMAVMVPGSGMPSGQGMVPPQSPNMGMGSDPSADGRGGRSPPSSRNLQPKQGSNWHGSERRGGRGPQDGAVQRLGFGDSQEAPMASGNDIGYSGALPHGGHLSGHVQSRPHGKFGVDSPHGPSGAPQSPMADNSEPVVPPGGGVPTPSGGQSPSSASRPQSDKDKKKTPANPWADVQDSGPVFDDHMIKMWGVPQQQEEQLDASPHGKAQKAQSQPKGGGQSEGRGGGGGKSGKRGGNKGWEEQSSGGQQASGGRSGQKWVEAQARIADVPPPVPAKGQNKGQNWVMKEAQPQQLASPKPLPMASAPGSGSYSAPALPGGGGKASDKKKSKRETGLDDWLAKRFDGQPAQAGSADGGGFDDDYMVGEIEADASTRGGKSRGGKGKSEGGRGGGRKDKGKSKGKKGGSTWQRSG